MEMNRVLLKLSGEALAGEKKQGFDEKTVYDVAGQVKKILDKGIQLCVVIGGGNFWRGRTSENMDRVKADSIGMLATVMNCIYTADAFRVFGIKSHIMTPFACGTMTELFNRDKAVKYMEQGEVVSVSPSEGAEVKEGTTVTLVISKGNQPATVPKLTGKSQSDAEAALSQAGLSGNATEDYSDTVEEGVIISQDTDAGKEVSKGTTIGYVVSKGPKMTVVTVPSILSFDKNAAEKKLKEAGLVPEYLGEDDSVNEYGQGQVSYQSISAGTQVEKGTTVQYKVSKGSQPSAPDSGNSGNDSGTEENTNQ